MKKQNFEWHGKKYFLLGTDKNGIKYYLQEAQWDCGWYWGGGYIETFSNNRCPKISKDIASHQHFDGLFFGKNKNGYDMFKDFFDATPFDNSEIWTIIELMKTFYIMRHYSDTIYRGGSYYTSNPVADIIKNDTEYDRINKTVIPAINEAIEKLLSEDDDNDR